MTNGCSSKLYNISVSPYTSPRFIVSIKGDGIASDDICKTSLEIKTTEFDQMFSQTNSQKQWQKQGQFFVCVVLREFETWERFVQSMEFFSVFFRRGNSNHCGFPRAGDWILHLLPLIQLHDNEPAFRDKGCSIATV